MAVFQATAALNNRAVTATGHKAGAAMNSISARAVGFVKSSPR